MEKFRQNGFALILLAMVIMLITAEVVVLTGIANTMLFDSKNASIQAVERNLSASGLAWAKQNLKDQKRESFNRAVELDVTNMNTPGSTLTVTMEATNRTAEVWIRTSYSRGGRSFRRSNKYHIEL